MKTTIDLKEELQKLKTTEPKQLIQGDIDTLLTESNDLYVQNSMEEIGFDKAHFQHKLEMDFGRENVFTIRHIEIFCTKYVLCFSNAENYIGGIDPVAFRKFNNLRDKLLKYCEMEKDSKAYDKYMENGLYDILTPKFLKAVVTGNIKEFGDEFDRKHVEPPLIPKIKGNSFIICPREELSFSTTQRIVNLDPMLFFKTQHDFFILIHKWGNDMTKWELFKRKINHKTANYWDTRTRI